MKNDIAFQLMTLTMLLVLGGLPASADPLKTPPGCVPTKGAQAAADSAGAGGSDGGYADRVVHEKTGIELVLISAGSFTMGNAGQFSSATAPPRRVNIAKLFYMGKTEVTNAQYRKFVEASGYKGKADTDPGYDRYLTHWRGKSLMSNADDHPIVWVSWKNAKAFCQWSDLALPTEAQWEYACRAGTKTLFYFGDKRTDFEGYGWCVTNSDGLTQAVAGKKPNAWGLYDMLGNTWEWVEDDYIYRYHGAPTDGSARVEGKLTKVIRGGAWSVNTQPVTSSCATRFNYAPVGASNDIGFRVVLGLPTNP